MAEGTNMKPKSWWHIRKSRKTSHGALIVGEDSSSPKGNYRYMGINTHPAKNEGYIKLDKPISQKNKQYYVRKYVGTAKKKTFSK